MRGKIVTWKDDKGFGFIRPAKGGRDVFLHISDLRHKGYQPRIGDAVDFSLTTDDKGQPRATGAAVPGIRKYTRDAPYSFTLIVPAMFAGALIGIGVHRYVLLGYLGMSLVTLLAYYLDKRRAKSDRWRIPEARLHLLALLGGWPGAGLAQQTLRHKTRKQSFQLTYWTIAAAHIAGWIYLWNEGMAQRIPTAMDFW